MHVGDPGQDTHSTACNIISSNIPGLTAAGGVISNGTQNVILYCICNRSNVAVGPSIWFINGDQVTLTQEDGSGKPYYRDNVPSPLIIPSFVSPYDGTYRCASGSLGLKIADNIILALPSMCDYFKINSLYYYMYAALIMLVCSCYLDY